MRISKNNEVLRFCSKTLLILLLLCVAAHAFTPLIDHQLRNGFLNSYEDKLKSLERTDGKKTVFVGGSSVLFGFSAEQYQKLSGEKAINMGLNAGTYDVYFSSITPHIRPGDTVVLALEYEAYGNDWYQMNDTFLDLAHLTKGYYKSLPLKLMPEYYFKSTLNKYRRVYTLFYQKLQTVLDDDEQLYSRSLINEYGDVRKERLSEKPTPEPHRPILSVNEDTLHIIREYIAEYESKGANVYLVFPPCYMEADSSVFEFEDELKAYFGDMLLGHASDWLLEDIEYVYDTPYHLNAEGINARTEYLYSLITEANNS